VKLLRPLSLLLAAATGAALAQDSSPPPRLPAATWLESINVSASATASAVENISRTSFAPTRKNANTYEMDLDASRHQQLSAGWLLELAAGAEWLQVPDYSLTGNLSAGPRAALQYKFGLGPLAPVLQFNTAFTYKDARFAADRGWTTEGGVRLAQRVDPSLKVAVGCQWLDHNAASSTFDLQQRTLSLEAAWDINENWRLSASASRLTGRVVANAAWAVWQQAISGGFGSAVADYYNAIPSTVTGLYGPGWVSYNVEADANLWSLALSYAVTAHTTFELRYQNAYVINHVNVRYPAESWGLGCTHRF
jgi:hypothetical protein